jgi:hypothetical protein
MEVQVNVAQDDGYQVKGEYKGRNWLAYSDGIEEWKSFRIPHNAKVEPEYDDNTPLLFNLEAHALGIGLTGWNWRARLSQWVAYDFDDIISHKKGLSAEQLSALHEAAASVPWVKIMRSTSGSGLHFYIHLQPYISTDNHTEHGALARSILAYLSAHVGFDFRTKVDACGGNMWIWHRKTKGTNGFSIVKNNTEYFDARAIQWRDHIEVVSGKSSRVRYSQGIDGVAGQMEHAQLDDEHKRLIRFLGERQASWVWDSDRHMLTTHTKHLVEAQDQLGLRGMFTTASSGTTEMNCFCFPLPDGAWVVRRYTKGTPETDLWDLDANGWTRTYLNKNIDFERACAIYGGIETEKGAYSFESASSAAKVLTMLQIVHDIPDWAQSKCLLKPIRRDNKIAVQFLEGPMDNKQELSRWLYEKGLWKRIFQAPLALKPEIELASIDDEIRHIIDAGDKEAGWVLNNSGKWIEENVGNITKVLRAKGYGREETEVLLGHAVMKGWSIVNLPFRPEYCGHRTWNINAAQLRHPPSQSEELSFPLWSSILQHIGASLDRYILENDWCRTNGITSGGDYLKCWIANIIQNPDSPLPFLFLYGDQNSGKTSLYQAIETLFTRGFASANTALTNQQGFNGEIEGAVVCVIEETNIADSKLAYNRIKDWVTSPRIQIHPKGRPPYMADNRAKWIQCSNNPRYCPVLPGDTRITVIRVDRLRSIIPTEELRKQLLKEGPDFTAELLRMEIPYHPDRLKLPVISTSEKEVIADSNTDPLSTFLRYDCVEAPGYLTKFDALYNAFVSDMELHERWSKIKFGKEMPPKYPKGRHGAGSQMFFGNILLKHEAVNLEERKPFILKDGFLVQ